MRGVGTTPALLCLAALALAASAPRVAAQEKAPGAPEAKHDLRVRPAPVVGETLKVELRRRMEQRFRVTREGEVIEEGRDVQGFGQTFSNRVEAVDGKAVTGVRRDYTSVTRFGKPDEVKRFETPIPVTLRVRERRWVHGRVGDASAPLPKLLDLVLRSENEGEVDTKASEQDPYHALVAEAPVAAGAEWPVDPRKLATTLGMNGAHVNVKASRAKGRLVEVSSSGGVVFYRVELTFALALTHLMGQAVKTPARLEGSIKLGYGPKTPARSARATATLSYAGDVPGRNVPKGTQLTLRMNISMVDVRELPPKRSAGPAPR